MKWGTEIKNERNKAGEVRGQLDRGKTSNEKEKES